MKKIIIAGGAAGGAARLRRTGSEGVDKRIDVQVAAIRAGLTADRLAKLGLRSAPPYGDAKDTANIFGCMTLNVMHGSSHAAHWQNKHKNDLLLDVRTDSEHAADTVPGTVHILLEALRLRIKELPKDRTIVSFSETGQRGYTAERILIQRGYRAKNLSGGCSLNQIFSKDGEPHGSVRI